MISHSNSFSPTIYMVGDRQGKGFTPLTCPCLSLSYDRQYLFITERYIKGGCLYISMIKNIEDKIMRKRCLYCGKEISSLSKKQLEFNYYSHIGSCKKREGVKHQK